MATVEYNRWRFEELQTVQLYAATAQAEVRSGMSLVDTKLLAKRNMYYGELDGERTMVDVVVQNESLLCGSGTEAELMGSSSQQELEIMQDGMTTNDAAHCTTS